MAAVFQVRALSVAALILVLCVFQSFAWVATPIRTKVCLLTKSTRPKTFLFKSTLDNDGDDDDDDGWGEEGQDIPEELARIQASPSKVTQQKPERDLFIPIFAVVSLLGLFGSYGYEMMRLSSRGELYLPWN